MTNAPPSDDDPEDDDGWLAETAARALERSSDGRVRIERLARLDGGSTRNVVARAVAHLEDGTTESVVVKTIRSVTHDAGSPSVLRDSGLAREHVALTLLDARSNGSDVRGRLLAGDTNEGLIVLRDLGDDVRTLVAPLLGADTEAGDEAVSGLAEALGRLHAATSGCERDYAATVAGLYPAADGARPSALEGLRWASRRMDEALGGRVDDGVLETLAERLEAPGPWAALTHGDPCPDNALSMPDGSVALLDFEFARPGHALFDATWWHMGFPSCWCAGTLPEELVVRADARYRAVLAATVPEARDDSAYECELVHLCAVQLLWSAPRVLDGASGENGTWGTSRYRERLVHWLSTVVRMLGRTGALPILIPTVEGWLDAVRCHDEGIDALPPYPPWRPARTSSR